MTKAKVIKDASGNIRAMVFDQGVSSNLPIPVLEDREKIEDTEVPSNYLMVVDKLFKKK